jgi:predicted neuraminidase
VYRSDSDDNGTTWSAAYPTILPNNNSGLDLARVANGTLILAYNPITGNWGRRTPLSLAASTDNGESWTALRDLSAGEGEFSYPAVISVGARLHVTYTWNRKNIIHHEFQLNNPP